MGRPPHTGVDIGEAGGCCRWRFVDGPDNPDGHDPAQERSVGAHETVATVGTVDDALGCQSVDSRFVDRPVVIPEPTGRTDSGRARARPRPRPQGQARREPPSGSGDDLEF